MPRPKPSSTPFEAAELDEVNARRGTVAAEIFVIKSRMQSGLTDRAYGSAEYNKDCEELQRKKRELKDLESRSRRMRNVSTMLVYICW